MRVPWTLTDYSTGAADTWEFPVNPLDHEPPNRSANITTAAVTAASGQVILFQGRDAVQEGSVQGASIGAQMYLDLRTWLYKPYPIEMTDDLLNTNMILVSEVSFRRLHRAIERHRYDYTFKYKVIS